MIIWALTILYVIFMVLTTVFEYRYSDVPGKERNTQTVYTVCKMITSGLFLVMAIVAYILSGNALFFALFPAFLFCFAGDLFLALGHEIDNRLKNPQFIIGVIAFAIGQVILCFVFFGLLDWHISWEIIIPFIVLGYTIFCNRSEDYEFGINAIPCCIYGFFVGLSGGLGLQLIITDPHNLIWVLLGIGAISFLISDGVLSMKLFWKKDVPWAGAGVILFYFGAMWFLTTAIGMCI